jgi:hypothetical protein
VLLSVVVVVRFVMKTKDLESGQNEADGIHMQLDKTLLLFNACWDSAMAFLCWGMVCVCVLHHEARSNVAPKANRLGTGQLTRKLEKLH